MDRDSALYQKEELLRNLASEIRDKRVLEAMASVPREEFVPLALRHLAYEDRPLSIGYGQTISQPFIVALMIEALGLKGNEKVLEVGTGSGYQAVVLSMLAREVISVERIPELANWASETLKRLGYQNVSVYLASKVLGWPQERPYDAIIVAAAAPEIPEALLDQLANGGRLVIPVGSRYEQTLVRVTRDSNGDIVESLGGCRFVPLIGQGAWPPD